MGNWVCKGDVPFPCRYFWCTGGRLSADDEAGRSQVIESYSGVSSFHPRSIKGHQINTGCIFLLSWYSFRFMGKLGLPSVPFGACQSFRHGRWIIYKGISFFMYSQALLGESYIRRFYFVLGSHKARLPRMQLLRQFLLRILILSFFFMHALGQNSVQTFGWKFRTDVSIPLPWTLQCIWSLTRSLVSVG